MTYTSVETGPGRDVSDLSAMTLYFCFFVSGVAGLIYEVLWAKYLALYVGSTGLAQIIVLATFMGGLALGSQVLGALADRVRRPLKMYAFLELCIGVYALLFDSMFNLGRDVFIAIVRASGLTAGGLIGGKIAACVLSVLLPTFLMGGTLPSMGRYMMRTLNVVGPRISRLYFINSLGAVMGCLLAGFYLIANYGLQFSMIFGGIFSILSGLVALVVLTGERRAADAAAPSPETGSQNAEPIPAWATFVVFAAVGISGAVSMMYEVGWIRLLTLVLGSSTYSFSLMLAAFILGLAIGSFLLSFRKRTTGYAMIFGLSETAVGLTVLLMLPLYVKLPYWFNQLASSLNREPATFGLYQVCTFFMCALVMIVPTILQGITLPAAIKVLAPDIRRLGHRIGYAYAINTVGTLIGSVGAGFLGLPVLGIKGMIELAVGLNTVLGIAVLFAERRAPLRRWVLAGAVLMSLTMWGWYGVNMGSWDREMLSAGYYRKRERLPSFHWLQKQMSEHHTVYYKDGVAATVLVQDYTEPVPERLLIINGKGDASTRVDLPTQKMLGHLPMILHPRPEKVLIVGVGSGATIGSVLAYDGVKQVDIVEINRDVIEASRLFDTVNGRYWEDPRVRVYWEDAKTFLQIADQQYDLIISEPTNPWIAGIAGVFSREFFDTCLRRLAPGGLFTQWVQAYELEDTTFYMILETFTSVFPCYTLWNPTFTDTILVGSSRPYGPDFQQMDARVKQPDVHRDLESMGLSSLLPILSFQMADCASRPSHVNWVGVIHSDFFPFLEYAAPRGFFVGTDAKGIRLLDRRSQSPVNAKLWVQDYLKDCKVGSDQLRECFQFSFSNQCLFAFATPAWAREWARRYPSDPEADVALLHTAQPTFEADLQQVRVKDRAAKGFASGKSRCRFEFLDYSKSRNYLAPGAASNLLGEIQSLMKKYPEENDPQLFRWCGCLEYDMGMYPQSASNLTVAVSLLEGGHGANSDRIDAGLELCESLLALGERERARSVCEGPLAPFSDELNVVLMKSRIRDGL
jgi:spermidine synthase